MTDGLDQRLQRAGLDLLDADPLLTVHDGAVPAGAARPYVLVYTTISYAPRSDPDNAMDGVSRVRVPRWICHCVGDNADAARAVAQRVRTALLNIRPVVVGFALESITPIEMEGESLPPVRDETTGVLVMDAVETYRLRATS